MKHDKSLSPLGTFIKYERMALGCTVKIFCKECGITPKTYYRLIEKKSHPKELCQGHRLPLCDQR